MLLFEYSDLIPISRDNWKMISDNNLSKYKISLSYITMATK